jgi:hypothetical protein
MKYWESIADNLSKAGFSWGYVAGERFGGTNDLDCRRTLGGKRFIVHADENLTAFLELESAIWTYFLGRTYE